MTDPTTPPITAEQLAAWEAIEKAATAGPWDEIGGCNDDNAADYFCRYVGPAGKYPVLWAYGRNRTGNCVFVATARTALPALLAEVRRLQAIEAAAKDLVGSIGDSGCNGCWCYDGPGDKKFICQACVLRGLLEVVG